MGMFSIIILHCLECKYIHIIGTCFMFWNVSRRDKIIFSCWGGGNFFYVTTRQNNFFVVGWGQFFFMSRRDKIIFSWWVEPTKSSLFNIIWASLHHPPRKNYFVSSWHRGGSFHLNPIIFILLELVLFFLYAPEGGKPSLLSKGNYIQPNQHHNHIIQGKLHYQNKIMISENYY